MATDRVDGSGWIHNFVGAYVGVGVVVLSWVFVWFPLGLAGFVAPAAVLGIETSVTNAAGILLIFDAIVWFLLYAPFYAAQLLGATHGFAVTVTTPVGEVAVTEVPVVTGLFELLLPIVLLCTGILAGYLTPRRLLVVPIVATITAVCGYVTALLLVVSGTALVYNFIVVPINVLYSELVLGITIYPLLRGFDHASLFEIIFVSGRLSLPYIAGGAVIGTVIQAYVAGSGGWMAEDRRAVDHGGPRESSSEWAIEMLSEILTDVAIHGERAYVVGERGSVFRDAGDGWNRAAKNGPVGEPKALVSVDTTVSGTVWYAGENGSVGRYDESTDQHRSHSEPHGDTTDIVAIAAAATDGKEIVLLADTAGRLRRGRYVDGELVWDEPSSLANEENLQSLSLPTTSQGYACTTDESVFGLTDGGRTSSRVSVDLPGSISDVAATDRDGCVVCDDSGVVAEYTGDSWGTAQVTNTPLESIAVRNGKRFAIGSDDVVFERDGDEWVQCSTGAGSLCAVAAGDARVIVVGPGGVVAERHSA